MMRYVAIAAVLLLSGCASGTLSTALDRPVSHVPVESLAVSSALTAELMEPEIVDMPSLPSWPVVMGSGGPFDALFELSPVVVQMGVLADTERADTGLGFGLVFGYKLLAGGTKTLGIEGKYEQSGHRNAASDVDGTATRLLAAGRLTFAGDEKLRPFGVGGLGLYSLQFKGLDSKFNLNGGGLFSFGGGIDYAATGSVAIRSEMVLHIWDAAEQSGAGGVASTLAISVGGSISF